MKNEKKNKNNIEIDEDPKNELSPNAMPNIKKKKSKNTNKIEKSNKKSQKINVEDTNKTKINENNNPIKSLELNDNEETKTNELPSQNSKLDTPNKNDNKTNLKKRKNNKKEKLKFNEEINQYGENEENNNDHNLQPGNTKVINEEKDTLFIDIKEKEEAKENSVYKNYDNVNNCVTVNKIKTNNRNNTKNKNTKEKNVKLVTQNTEITNLIKQDQKEHISFINNDDDNKKNDPEPLMENEKDSKSKNKKNFTKLKNTNEKKGVKEKNDIDQSKKKKKKEIHKLNDKTEQVKIMVLDSISKQNSPIKNEACKEIVGDNNNNLEILASSCPNASLNAKIELSQNVTENKSVEPEKGKLKKNEKTKKKEKEKENEKEKEKENKKEKEKENEKEKEKENDKIKQNEHEEDNEVEIQDKQTITEETQNNEEMKIHPKDQEKFNEKEKKKSKYVTEIKKTNKKEELNKGKPIKIVLSDTDAKEKIYKYMRQTNRPYSVINVYDNLHGMISKNSVQKIMDELSIEKKLQCKEYGKAKIYLINQKEFESLNVEEINKLKNCIDVVKEEAELAKNYYNDLLKKKKKLIEDLNLIKNVSEYKKSLLQIEDEIHIYEETNKNCKISIDEIDIIKNNHGYLHSVWFKRKKLCNEIIKCIASLTEKDTQGVIYHLGIDTDEDVIPLNLYF
ncbi:Tat binding protein 1(TBP-1)-interacting protein, putative [Plasmodium berghei]|uniref:Tat binding protein 1(TBP-1)-interacting protein, putative n=1 Tax=Plasmodium berghei TaxID=5821 RepID=A0A1C6Y8Z9_PLABE|nr:Tat binding protein 1(TBP-1)-interacting protein, putative [Plasmodium berghei]